jgi:putative hemolysin
MMQEEIIEPIDPKLITQEIELLTGQLLVELKRFQAFSAKSAQIPNTLREIGRLREITYREVGEGTGKSIDLDEFDEFCDHIFIWDTDNTKIVGAYRLLPGRKIMDEKGVSGFYVNTLFDLDKDLEPILWKSLELGRSFIVQEYQKRPTPLFLLWKALLFSVLNSDARYLIGPVSISGTYTEEAKSLIYYFLHNNFFDVNTAKSIHPKNNYTLSLPEDFDENWFKKEIGDDFNKLDKYIQTFDPTFHTPILVRQYISLLGTKVLGFNVDPLFNNCLDALMLMDLTKSPQQTIENLAKDHPDPSSIYEKLKNDEYRA